MKAFKNISSKRLVAMTIQQKLLKPSLMKSYFLQLFNEGSFIDISNLSSTCMVGRMYECTFKNVFGERPTTTIVQ